MTSLCWENAGNFNLPNVLSNFDKSVKIMPSQFMSRGQD